MFPCQGLEGRGAQSACTAWMAWKSDCTHCSYMFVGSAQHVLALLKGTAPIALTFPPEKQRLMAWVCGWGTKTTSTYYTLLR